MPLLALLALAADPVPGPIKSFGDWVVACDNVHACEMTSLLPGENPFPGENESFDAVALSIARAPGPAGGFDVELQFLEPGAYTDARKSGQFDLAIQEIGRAQNPGPNYQIIIGDSAFGNFYKEINPAVVGMIQQAQAELDAAKRDAAYKKIQQTIYDDNVEFPIYFRELIWGVRKRVTGFQGRVGGDTRVYYCGVQ